MTTQAKPEELTWNNDLMIFECPTCGNATFSQLIVAENYVILTAGEGGELIESSDFEGDWEVRVRGTTSCTECNALVIIPHDAQIVEESQRTD